MTVNTWIASAPGNASVAGNWSLGHAPQTGEDVVFDGTSINNCSWDISGVTINSLTIAAGYTGTVTQAAVDIYVGSGGITLSGSSATFTGISTQKVTCYGPFNRNSDCTLTGDALCLVMKGIGTILANNGTVKAALRQLTISANVTLTAGNFEVTNFTVDAGATLTVNATLTVRAYPGNTYANNGAINGSGILTFATYYTTAVTVVFGVINCSAKVYAWASALGNTTLIMGADAVFGSSLQISCDATAYTCTLTSGSNYKLTVVGAVTLGARGCMTQGTGAWSFGSFVQSGASSVFSQGANVYAGDVTVSDGATNCSTSLWWIISGSFSYPGGAISNLCAEFTGTNKNIAWSPVFIFKHMKISGTINIADFPGDYGAENFTNTGVLNVLPVGKNFTLRPYTSKVYSNTGTINIVSASSSLKLYLYDVDVSMAPGNINGNIRVHLHTAATSGHVLTLTAPLVCGTFLLTSDNATYAVTLDLNGYGLSASSITQNARTVILCGEGRITSRGLDASAGTLTPETCTYVSMGGTVKLASGQSLYDVEAPGVPLNILSDVPIAHSYKHALPTVLNGHSIPLTHPELEVWLNADQLRGSRTPLIALMGAL